MKTKKSKNNFFSIPQHPVCNCEILFIGFGIFENDIALIASCIG